MAPRIRILSLNIGLKSDLAGLSTLIKVHKLDLVLLQEVRISDEQINQKVGHLGFTGKVNVDADNPMKPGTALVWRSVLPVTQVSAIVPCRAQYAVLESLAILNIYAPSGSDKRSERGIFFARDVFQTLSLSTGCFSWIMGGDFNCVLSPLDVKNGTGYNQKRCPQLSSLITGKKLHDAFRHMYPITKDYTFFRTSSAPSRLDRFYLSEEILKNVYSVKHVASLSDHCGVLLDMACDNLYQSVRKLTFDTYWKLNVKILKDEDFRDNFAAVWEKIKLDKKNYADIADWWDFKAKPIIKAFCYDFSKQRKHRRNDSKSFWLAYLKIVLGESNWSEVSRVKGILADMLQEDAFGYVVRSRFQNNVSDEVASLFHANQEIKNATKNSISSLKIKGVVSEHKETIEKEVTDYFEALFNGHHDKSLRNTGEPFKADNSRINFFLDELDELGDQERDSLVKEMRIEELEEIIKDCEKNKSPGLDGLPYEFYQENVAIIKEDLLEIFKCQLNRKRLIESNREGVTRLAPKVDGVPTVGELRPHSGTPEPFIT